MKTPAKTPYELFKTRFFGKKASILGGLVILAFLLLSFLAYLVIPDSSPNANRQIPEIALENPGYRSLFLLHRKNEEAKRTSIFYRLFNGQKDLYTYIPIDSFWFDGSDIVFNRKSGQQQQLSLIDVVYPLKDRSHRTKSINTVEFITFDDNKLSREIEDLKREVNESFVEQRTFWLGTDKYGRCILSRIILGIRVSLAVGFLAVLISLTLGIFLGGVAGYFGGKVDSVIMMLMNISWSIPTLLLVFAIVLALGRGIGIIFLAVGLTMWVDVARIVRSQVLSIKEENYIKSAQSLGYSVFRIIFVHVIPNLMGPVLVIAAANFAMAILVEAGLSYLGFGIKPPSPSLGTILNENYGYAISGKPLIAFFPALVIMLLVLSFNLVGTGLRDAFDVRSNE